MLPQRRRRAAACRQRRTRVPRAEGNSRTQSRWPTQRRHHSRGREALSRRCLQAAARRLR
eukprot:1957864-Prymnesium_polylepis.1